MNKSLILLFLILFNQFGFGDEEQNCERKYNLSVCALFKNEAPFLKEWIEYHLLVGVDHFYLYDLGSNDKYGNVIVPYIKQGIVTLLHWPILVDENDQYLWALATQLPAYENAIKLKALHQTRWLALLDINEFLVPPVGSSIVEVLEKYDDFPGVMLPCEYFDASLKKNASPVRKLLIETLDLIKAPKYNPHRSIVKTICKPEECLGFIWPPYKHQFKNRQYAIAVTKNELRVNHYVNREMGSSSQSKNIAYADNRFLSEEEVKNLLDSDYKIEDQDRVIYRFIPELLVRMSYDYSWLW